MKQVLGIINRQAKVNYTQVLNRTLLRKSDSKWCLQDRGEFLLVIATPDMKMILPDLRTKACCHERAGEVFTTYPAPVHHF